MKRALLTLLLVLSTPQFPAAAPSIPGTGLFTDNRVNDIFGLDGWRFSPQARVTDPLGVPGNIASVRAVGRNAGDVYFLGLTTSLPGTPTTRNYSAFSFYTGQIGVYDITVTNRQGQAATTATHNLDKPRRLPAPQNLRVSDLTTTPLFTFDPVPGVSSYNMKIFSEDRLELFSSPSSPVPSFRVSEGIVELGRTYFLSARALDFDSTEPGNPLENRSANFLRFVAGSPPPIQPPQTAYFGTSVNRSAPYVSEPINTGTGNYFLQETELVIPGRGLPFVFTRAYNAQDSYIGPFGRGWTHSYNLLLTEAPDGSVTIKYGDGREEMFGPTGGGQYVPLFAGIFTVLEKLADGTFVLTLKNQTRYEFDATGKLTRLADRNGNAQTFQYDGVGQLHLITDTVGRTTRLDYRADGRMIRLVDPIGRVLAYGYDANGDLASITDFLSNVQTYAYDVSRRLRRIVDRRGNTLLENEYDAQGRVIRQTNGRGFVTTLAYDAPALGLTTVMDPRGAATLYIHDDLFRLLQRRDANGGVREFFYDIDSDLVGILDENARLTQFTYDARGNVLSIRDPLGRVTLLTYDIQNNLRTARNARGFTTVFGYDGPGNLTSIQDALGHTTVFAYDGSGQLVQKTDALGNTTSYAYDGEANLTEIADARSGKTMLTYDGIGRLFSLTDPNGQTAGASYDGNSRLTQIIDPLGNTTGFAYDAVGNLIEILDAKGSKTSYGYDTVNNLTAVTDALGNVTQYTYDGNNNRTGLTNASGHATSYAFDALNRLTQTADPLGNTTTYSYDPVGNVTAVTDANGTTNTFSYDANNRLTGIAYGDGSSVAYTYDANGSRVSMVDQGGTTSYLYDALDRLVQVNHPDGSIVAYGYDSVGNRTSLTYPGSGTASYTYDALNRVAQVAHPDGKTTGYAYDAASNLLQVTYPNGTAIAYEYDAANRLVRVENSRGAKRLSSYAYVLDSLGNRIERIQDGRFVTPYTYDALSQLVAATRPSGVRTDYTYDPVGNLLSVDGPGQPEQFSYDAANRLLQAGKKTFTYDANGNRITMEKGVVTQYGYDAANRLIEVSRGGRTSIYEYDGDGNKVAQTTGQETFQFTNDVATALPVVLSESGPTWDIQYVYGLGLISQTSSAFEHFYHYDGLGSVVNLTNPSGGAAAGYAYDPWGAPEKGGHASTVRNRFRFTGEELDDFTGLYYLRARWYDPSVGRFITRDPFPGFLLRTVSLNRFVYAENNPVKLIDRSGLIPETASTGTLLNAIESLALKGAMSFAREAIFQGARLRNQLRCCQSLQPYIEARAYLRTFGDFLTFVTLLSNANEEFQRRGISYQGIADGWRNAASNIVWGFKNPDALLDAAIQGVTVTEAIVINTLLNSTGVNQAVVIATGGRRSLHISGLDIQRWVSP
ncbi:MAG: RHS repeat-associated core domain-containing protein [Candidatus Methylomirabilales bacterium]